MRVLFMGTPVLASTILSALAREHEIVGVVTRPDAVRGRGSKTIPSPVKDMGLNLGAPVFERTSLRSEEDRKLITSLYPDIICVAACGIILPSSVLEIPVLGCINVHTSLLPRWRGAAPIERSILEGDETTGVCIMRMEEGLDTGDYCRRVEVPIKGAYVEELTSELAMVGARELVGAIADIESDEVVWTPQGEQGVSYAEKIEKGELSLSHDDAAWKAEAKVRASSAAHPARVEIAGRTMAIERARIAIDEFCMNACEGLKAGDARYAGKRLFLVMREGVLEVLNVKPDGKKSMDALSFAGGVQGIKNMKLSWGNA